MGETGIGMKFGGESSHRTTSLKQRDNIRLIHTEIDWDAARCMELAEVVSTDEEVV
jgi:hypothetical protein